MGRMTVIRDDHGKLVRLDLDQVGWRGQTGRLYQMGDDPSITEPGSFSPVWQIAHSDLVADLVPDGVAAVARARLGLVDPETGRLQR